MEGQIISSFKSKRFLKFSFTISSSFILLASLFTLVIKSNPSISHFQFKKSFLNFSGQKPITVESLSSFSGNDSAGTVKHSTVKDTPFVKSGNASGSDKFSVSKATQRQENEDPETQQEDAPGPSIEDIEVQSNELTEEDEVRANSVDKFELPSSKEHNEEKKTRVASVDNKEVPSNGKIEERRINSCDVTKGKWVLCTQMDRVLSLMKVLTVIAMAGEIEITWNGNGNPKIVTFLAKLLDLIRGTRLVFVGDSINRNQWESMLCMLMGAVRDPKKVYETHGRRITKEKGNYSFKFVVLIILWGGEWNSGGHCMEAAWPVNDTSGMRYPEKNKIVEVIFQMKTPITLLNVTGLSAYRIDGHPSIYGKKSGNRYSSNIQDCSHWCLPGVPDTWNEILYFYLQSKQKFKYHSRIRL